jgi:modulator of FtsH protease HflK
MTQKVQFGDMDIIIPKMNFMKIITGAAIFILVISLYTSVYTIDANENGVVLRFGKYTTTTMPGLHLKLPFGIDKVYKVMVDYQYKLEFGFRTEKPDVRTRYSKSNFDDESWMLTGDLNIAEVKWVVQYKIGDPSAYLFNVRNVDNTIRDVAETAMRLMVGDRSFSEAIQAERIAIADLSRIYMQEILDKYKTGISVQMVQLQGVHPPKPVSDSFNEVNRAKQEQEMTINEAWQAYNKDIYKAEGESKKMVNEAEGYAVKRTNEALGDVALFISILKEYKRAPQITKDRLYLESMESIFSRIKHKVIVDDKLQNFLPFMNLNQGVK